MTERTELVSERISINYVQLKLGGIAYTLQTIGAYYFFFNISGAETDIVLYYFFPSYLNF